MTRSRDRLLAEFSVASAQGNERAAAERVAQAVREVDLAPERLERLKTAVAEATLNAMEHGHHFRPELPVMVRVSASDASVLVTVTDEGGPLPSAPLPTPDIDAKLSGQQSPRGWGLFLIENMVDEVWHQTDGRIHTIHLKVRLAN